MFMNCVLITKIYESVFDGQYHLLRQNEKSVNF